MSRRSGEGPDNRHSVSAWSWGCESSCQGWPEPQSSSRRCGRRTGSGPPERVSGRTGLGFLPREDAVSTETAGTAQTLAGLMLPPFRLGRFPGYTVFLWKQCLHTLFVWARVPFEVFFFSLLLSCTLVPEALMAFSKRRAARHLPPQDGTAALSGRRYSRFSVCVSHVPAFQNGSFMRPSGLGGVFSPNIL